MPVSPSRSCPFRRPIAPSAVGSGRPEPAPFPLRLALAWLSDDSYGRFSPNRYGDINFLPATLLQTTEDIIDGLLRLQLPSGPGRTGIYHGPLRGPGLRRLRVELSPNARSHLLDLQSILTLTENGVPVECWLPRPNPAGLPSYQLSPLPPALHTALTQERPPRRRR